MGKARRGSRMLDGLLFGIVASLAVQGPAHGLDITGGVAEITTIAPGTVGFVATTTDAAVQRCLADAGYELQLIDVTGAGFASEITGALEGGLAVALWQSMAAPAWADLPQAQVVGRQMALAAQSGGYGAGGTVFLDLRDVPVGTPAQQILDWIDSWSDTVAAAGYVPGLRAGPNAGLSANQLGATRPGTFWASGGAVPALSVGYSVMPADQPEVSACGTTVMSYRVFSNAAGKTLNAARHTLGALPPQSTSGELGLSAPVSRETSTTSEAAPSASTSSRSVAVHPSTLSNTGVPTVSLMWPAGILVGVGVTLLIWTRRRAADHH
jgi:Domain of unknown function (DUF1906)